MKKLSNLTDFSMPAPTPKKSRIYTAIVLVLLIIMSLASTKLVNKKVSDVYGNGNQPVLKDSVGDAVTSERIILTMGKNNSWNVLGAEKAEILVVEFGDFTCPYSRASYQAARAMLLKHQKKVKLIFRNFLISNDSLGLALAAECAGEQGKFWPMHDRLYEAQSDTLPTDINAILNIAQSLNLDNLTFANCLSSKKYLDRIKADVQDAEKLEIKGTPTWFINGQAYQGVLSEEDWEKIIGSY